MKKGLYYLLCRIWMVFNFLIGSKKKAVFVATWRTSTVNMINNKTK